MTTKSAALALILAIAAAPAVLAQEPPEDAAEQAYYRAFYLEKAVRSFEEAVKAYDRAAEVTPADRTDLRARSLLGRGRCLAALGRADEAWKAFEEALRLDPGSEEAKSRLETEREILARDDELLDRISGLVNGLDQPARKQALKDLLLIGDRAVPQLEEALRSRSVGTAEGAAKALATIGTEQSFAALAGAFGDPEVFFPKVLVNSLGIISRADRGGLEVFLTAMRELRSDVRSRAISTLSARLTLSSFQTETTPSTLAGILELGLTDPAPETKVATLQLVQRWHQKLTGSGVDPIADGAWIALLRSEQPGVSSAAAKSLGTMRYSVPLGRELCRTLLALIAEVANGERSNDGFWHYTTFIRDPERRDFPVDELLALYETVVTSERLEEKARTSTCQVIEQYLLKARRNTTGGVPELFRDGWAAIGSPAGRERWITTYMGYGPCPPDLLLEAAGSDAPGVRRAAYDALTRSKLDEAALAPALRHAEADLLSGSKDVRLDLIQLLASFSIPSAADALRKFRAESDDEPLRTNALYALAKAVGEGALPDIRKELAGENWEPARTLLARILGEAAVPELVALAERIEDGSRPVAKQNGRYFNLMVPSELVGPYVAALPAHLRGAMLVHVAAPKLTGEARAELVIDALGRESYGILSAGIRTAGKLHVEEAWPYLVPLLDHQNETVRAEATRALKDIRTYRELRSSFERYGPGGPGQVLADAIGLTKSDDPLKRRGGALALGALGDTAGIAILLGLLEDADETVRDAALAALERLGGRRDTPEDK